MNTELGWLSTEFTRSLLLSEPSVTVVKWVTVAYQWLFVDSGFTGWIKQQNVLQTGSDNELTRNLNNWSGWLAGYLHEYLMATVWICVITLVRVTILVLSVPLFLMVVLVSLVEGLGRRDLRRYGAGYESSFVYHHAKKMVKPAIVVPMMLYLSWPTAVLPQSAVVACCYIAGCRYHGHHGFIQEISLVIGAGRRRTKLVFVRLRQQTKPSIDLYCASDE